MSTNAPNAVTFVTTPSSVMPSCTSSIVVTSSRKAGFSKTARGSRPGFFSSETMSFSVGSPTSFVMYLRTSILSASAALPTSAATSTPRSDAIVSTSAYRSGWTADASSGFAAPRMRRKPADCSNALGPSPVTFFRSLRLLNAPFALRHATIRLASDSPMPETRVRRGAEAVFSSTPTLFTQLTTTSSSFAPRSGWCTSCWYWPTPIAFGSIFTSSASGSCRRRPIEIAPRTVRSRSGNSSRATSPAE